jgi:glycerol-3-phosphate acyltransferase PlsX
MNAASSTRLVMDAYGGDHGPGVITAAALDAVKRHSALEVTLVGPDGDVSGNLAGADPSLTSRIRFVPAETSLDSGVGPVGAIRAGDRSSMGLCLKMVADGEADACVSAGSTTALMALGVRTLGMLHGLKRPALMARIPSTGGFTSMLDLGANLNVDAVQLVQFAIMGAVVCARDGRENPSIGILNVGHEETKGHSVVREAHERMQQLPLNYRGFIEGSDIFAGRVDVAVCDGFTGNLVLKSSEGLARMLVGELKNALSGGWRSRIGAALAGGALRGTLERFDPAQHNGAPLLGLNGVVVKSHGSAGRAATVQAVNEAITEAGKHVPERIQELITRFEAVTNS